MRINRRTISATSAAIALAFIAAACSSGAEPTRARTGAAGGDRIAQPPLDELIEQTRSRLAPDSARVDVKMPSFSRPTHVTNPLFPISELHSVVILGEVEGEPLKVETTLLPETKTVVWNGRRIVALQSQFLAFLKGRITECAIDLYAQADDGSVWYFGEDVVDYEKGRAATTEGTWLVGVDGPAAMIMPGHPKVGDVYRTENIPGVAFEEVTVKKTGQTVDGPTGPIEGAMIGEELHMEGDREPKTFAPHYGEFYSGSPHDFEANALTIPADAVSAPVPVELKLLSTQTEALFVAAASKDWKSTGGAEAKIAAAWDTLRAREMPKRLKTKLGDALDRLSKAVGKHDERASGQSALDVAHAALDLELRYRPRVDIDRGRFIAWTRQLELDAASKDAGNVAGDITTLAWIRDRLPLKTPDGERIDDQLRYLRSVADAKEFGNAMDEAKLLRDNLAAARTTS